jgi:carbon storage regulator
MGERLVIACMRRGELPQSSIEGKKPAKVPSKLIQLASRNAHAPAKDEQKSLKIGSLVNAPFPSFQGPCKKCYWHAACSLVQVGNNSTVMEVLKMLVLTRKVGEKIVIDGCISVTVLAVDGNKIRLGVTAPRKVRIDREEVHRQRTEFAEVEVDAEGLIGV